MTKQDFLLNELNDQIKRFEKESKRHKDMYRLLRYTAFGLTSCSTALASLAINLPDLQSSINVAIVVISTVVGVVTSIEGLRKPGELWIHERTTYYSLLDLKRELEFQSAAQGASVRVDEIFNRLQSILGSSGDKWNRQQNGGQGQVADGNAATITDPAPPPLD